MNSKARGVLSILLFFVIWEAAVRLGLVQTFVLASPTMIIKDIGQLLSTGELQRNVVASMTRISMGYSLALLLGVLIGVLMGWFRNIDDFVDPIIEMFRPVSPLAILPLAILWLGIGEGSKIFIVAYACIFPIVINTYAGVRSVPLSNVEAAKILGAQPDEMLRKVALQHSLPLIMTGARISFAVALIVIIAAEMVAADSGLGYMILTAQQTFHTADLFAGIVTIAVIGFLGDRLLRLLRAWLCPWYVETEQR
jgi:ABC-type nitrate/sulfonate/bicarbonate transport system permease component